jgi:anaerobic ribonucleoside-triphosphate reductase activating protein
MEMKLLPPNKGLVTFDIKWRTDTAGPSPDNNMRTEVFLLGCKKAQQGNPCKGCFNSVTWDIGKAEHSRDPLEIADFIIKNAPNKYITIGGGEPTDQIDYLIPLVKKLKENDFHIMMYTWRKIELLGIDNTNHAKVLNYIDILVDGEYKEEQRVYQQDLGDGMLSSIGSANQCVCDIKHMRETGETIKYAMKDLAGLYIKPDTNDLVYITKK